jgi:UDP-2,3-diacylglucosamine pyrophosphatase LpxH
LAEAISFFPSEISDGLKENVLQLDKHCKVWKSIEVIRDQERDIFCRCNHDTCFMENNEK